MLEFLGEALGLIAQAVRAARNAGDEKALDVTREAFEAKQRELNEFAKNNPPKKKKPPS